MYTVYESSGVLESLKELPLFSELVREDDLKSIGFKFYSRQAIEWTCSQEQILEAIATKENLEALPGGFGYPYQATMQIVNGCAIAQVAAETLFLFSFGLVCLSTCCFNPNKFSSKSIGTNLMIRAALLVNVALTILVFVYLKMSIETQKERNDLLRKLDAQVEGCSDEFMAIPPAVIEKELDSLETNLDASANYILMSLILTVVKALVAICFIHLF